jgi:predicted amidohydrolase
VKLVLIQPQLPAPTAAMMPAIDALLSDALLNDDGSLSHEDLVLLPEHTHRDGSRDAYLNDMRALAARLGAHVVGGSHHQQRRGGAVNAGVVVAPDGTIVGEYEKLRPYALERAVVEPGTLLGQIDVAGRRLLIAICADFWFADLFSAAEELPDVVLVPAFSVTRKASPDYSRALWRHLAIARAYELGVYVGVSDWGYSPDAPKPTTSGVAGFANPVTPDPTEFFTSVGKTGVLTVQLDFDALESFRRDRIERGFFWKSSSAEPELR